MEFGKEHVFFFLWIERGREYGNGIDYRMGRDRIECWIELVIDRTG